ncbi:MAG: EAL domain-containing protein [Alteromonadaceae bacterium]|nr:EAL domain-containing protein [Alteromonadaceae bacterium]
MSLSKQLYLGLLLVMTLVFVGTLWINVNNTRNYINTQLASHAQDTATSLGLSIKPFIGSPDDLPMVDGMIKAIFDSGYYQKVILKDNKGKIILEKTNPIVFDTVPNWFVNFFSLTPPEASTEVYDGWMKPKTLHITSHPGFGYIQLWQSAIKSSWMILALFLIAGTLVSMVLRTITDPIKKAAEQADEICQGNFVQVDDIPKPIELSLFVNAMNRMSRILQKMFNELTKQTEKYQRFAYIDELTGLANRRAFNNQFESLLANKEDNNSGFLMIIRLSSLDTINKSHGYIAGDEYVKQGVDLINKTLLNVDGKIGGKVSGNIKDNINATHKTYRLAGSDFAIIMQECNKDECQQTAVELMQLFNKTTVQATIQLEFKTDEQAKINNFAHIGITNYATDSEMPKVLAQADNALVKALSNKDGWQFSDKLVMPQGNSVWKQQLDQLLENEKVILMAQAITDKNEKLLYHELYARFNHTDHNTPIPMAQLMLVAERLNLAESFDKLVIRKVITQVKTSPGNVAINLSPASLGHKKFCQWLIDELALCKDICKFLTFEISEQSLIHHAENVCRITKALKALNCKITLEHFGASTSSFTHLMQIKPDHVKIDGSYSQQIENSTENQLFVQSLVNIAHSLQITVIAELVETDTQKTQLGSLFVDYFQGYNIDKPTVW